MRKVLKEAEMRYTKIEKVALALQQAVQKFKVYLKNHQGTRVSDQLLRQILQSPEMSGRMVAWSV